MNKIFLQLLSYPVLLGPTIFSLTMVNPVEAKEFVFEAPQAKSCQQSSPMSNLVCVRITNADKTTSGITSEDETPMLGFSEAESEAAIAMFGCDCIACINAIRQLNGLPPV